MSYVTGQECSTSTLHDNAPGGRSSRYSSTCVDVRASGGALEPLCTKYAAERGACTTRWNQSKGKRKISETTGCEHQSLNVDTKIDNQDACRSRTRLTKGEKLDVLKLRDAKIQVSEIARRLSCGERTVYGILKNKNALQEEAKSPGFNDARKSERPCRYPKVEEGVKRLLNQAREHRLPVTQEMITSFAETAKRRLLSGEDLSAEDECTVQSFRVNPTWVKNFVRRQDVVMSTRPHGEADGVDEYTARYGVEQMKAACGDYKLHNIFHVGETGLFFRLLPRRTYMFPHEGKKTIRGMKDMGAKHRVTLYACTNATGSARVPLSIVGKSKTPRCFEGKRVPITYFSQSNAWSDAKTFRGWFDKVFLPFARQHTRGNNAEDRVLLLVDSRGYPDQLIDPEGRVKVMVYPPNCTGKDEQPMHRGIIAATKVNYRRRLLERWTEILPNAERLRAAAKDRKMRAGTPGLSQGHQPHMLDVAELINLAWNDVTDETISRCWARADPFPQHYQNMLSGGSTELASSDQEMPGMLGLAGVVVNLSRTLAALEVVVEADPIVKELVDSLHGLGIKPGDGRLNQSTLDAVAKWAVIEDEDDIVEALRLDMQEILEAETDLRPREWAGSHAENVDGHVVDVVGGREGLSRILRREEVLKHLDAVEGFVATCDHDDFLRHLRRYKTTLLSASFALQ